MYIWAIILSPEQIYIPHQVVKSKMYVKYDQYIAALEEI